MRGFRALAASVTHLIIRRRTLFMLVIGLLMVGLADGTPVLWATGFALLLLSQAIRLLSAGYIEKDETLVTSGPFACTRNPLYVSNMFGAVGMVLMCGRLELLVPVVVGWFVVHLPTVAHEEQFLREKFGAQFEEYCRRVPRWLPRCAAGGDGRRFSLTRVIANREHYNMLGGWLIAAVFFIEMVK